MPCTVICHVDKRKKARIIQRPKTLEECGSFWGLQRYGGREWGRITFTFHSVWISNNKNLQYTKQVKHTHISSRGSVPMNLHFLHNTVIQKASCLKEKTESYIERLAVQKSGLMESSTLN